MARRNKRFSEPFTIIPKGRACFSTTFAFEKIRQQEVLEFLEKLPPDIQKKVNRATRSMVKKLFAGENAKPAKCIIC